MLLDDGETTTTSLNMAFVHLFEREGKWQHSAKNTQLTSSNKDKHLQKTWFPCAYTYPMMLGVLQYEKMRDARRKF